MAVKYERCSGIDVHKTSMVGCVIVPRNDGQPVKVKQRVGTMRDALQDLWARLRTYQVTTVAIESTGVFWKAVYHILDGQFEIRVVHPQPIKPMAGRKTDRADAAWIADLLRHGLLHDLRDLTRYRTKLGDARTSEVNRLQKVLKEAHLKIASVMKEIMGRVGEPS